MKKLFQKLKKLKSKKNPKTPPKITETPTIKKPLLTDMTGINYFKYKNGGVILKDVDISKIQEEKRQNFKKLNKHEQLKTLFNYIKEKTEGGLYKKEGNRVIGEYFSVGKDLIGKLLKELETSKHITMLTELDRFYKILKEDF